MACVWSVVAPWLLAVWLLFEVFLPPPFPHRRTSEESHKGEILMIYISTDYRNKNEESQFPNNGSKRDWLGLKLKELNFGDKIKPKPRGSTILIYHNDRIYSFGGVDMDMAGRCFQEMWELNLSSKRWTNCELHTSAVGSGTKPRAPSKETIFNFSSLG